MLTDNTNSVDRHRFEPSQFWTPARFLLAGGAVLLLLGFLGAVGVLSRISPGNLFNPPYWIHWVHLSVGGTSIAVALAGSGRLQRAMTFVPAVLGTALGIGGLVVSVYSARRLVTSQSPDFSDDIAHLCVGGMALWALWNTRTRTRSGAA